MKKGERRGSRFTAASCQGEFFDVCCRWGRQWQTSKRSRLSEWTVKQVDTMPGCIFRWNRRLRREQMRWHKWSINPGFAWCDEAGREKQTKWKSRESLRPDWISDQFQVTEENSSKYWFQFLQRRLREIRIPGIQPGIERIIFRVLNLDRQKMIMSESIIISACYHFTPEKLASTTEIIQSRQIWCRLTWQRMLPRLSHRITQDKHCPSTITQNPFILFALFLRSDFNARYHWNCSKLRGFCSCWLRFEIA